MSLASELREITSDSFEALHSSTLDLIKTYLIDEMKQAAKKGWTYGFAYATVIRKIGVSQNKLLDKKECLRRLKEWAESEGLTAVTYELSYDNDVDMEFSWKESKTDKKP